MRGLFAGLSSVRGVIDHSSKEAEMRCITQRSLALRLSLLSAFVFVVTAVVPLVALAGNGDPGGI